MLSDLREALGKALFSVGSNEPTLGDALLMLVIVNGRFVKRDNQATK